MKLALRKVELLDLVVAIPVAAADHSAAAETVAAKAMAVRRKVVAVLAVVTRVDAGNSSGQSDVISGGWRSRMYVNILGLLASLILRALNMTLRWSKEGFHGDSRTWPYQPPLIIAFWHGHQLFMPWILRNCVDKPGARTVHALISQHRDGRIIAKAVDILGVKSIAGSSTRGGREAVFSLLKTLREGGHIAVTPDGPKGPIYVVKLGVVSIARKSGAKIYPCAVGFDRFWELKSWDRMRVPKPFSRAVHVMLEPIIIPSDCSPNELESYRAQLEREIMSAQVEADNFFEK